MKYLHLAAHLFLLLFWARAWVKPANTFYFNPFLSGTVRLIDRITGFLRPALMLPDRLTAVALLLFFWAFQTLFFARFDTDGKLLLWAWSFVPAEVAPLPGQQFAASGLSFAYFLTQLWTAYFLVGLIAPPGRPTRAQEAFSFFTSPFSRLPRLAQPLVLLTLHLVLVLAMFRLRAHTHTVHSAAQLLRLTCYAAISFTNALHAITLSLFFFVFAGLGAQLLGAKTLALICRESVETLLGRFARTPTPGSLGFAPLIFFFVVNFIHGSILSGVLWLIAKIP